ncbi:hypothetical protein [Kiloniella sp. b19]|uniref:hypothetical protein n=1 Tax=Kiloniella sp. GXU_MW_B19 TaxID=3141326 RepID=UPI0031D0785B
MFSSFKNINQTSVCHAVLFMLLFALLVLGSGSLTRAHEAPEGGGEHGSHTLWFFGQASAKDKRYSYAFELLQKVLEHPSVSSHDYQVMHSPFPVTRSRALKLLEQGRELGVAAEAPKPDWTEKLITVRIPLRKGIQGYRLFLIRRDFQDQLNEARTLADLRNFTTGSGAEWSTRRVMEEAGFKVEVSQDYQNLFEMLRLGRFDTFGRGVNEIYDELELHQWPSQNLAIDEKFALFIPLPTYFYVAPDHPELAEIIQTGLEAMIADGSFDLFFWEHHRALIEKSNLVNRTIFRLPNPNLSSADPVDEARYWFNPLAEAN